jgi:hypothetical protein
LDKLGAAAVVVIAVAVAHPLCDLFFRCGCGWLGPSHCNIHHAAGPHCPWCVEVWRFVAVGVLWLAGAWLGSRLTRGRSESLRFIASLAGLFIGATVSAAITVALTGYPHFLVW